MGKFLTNISLYLGREWNAMWRLDYCPEWPLEAAFLLRCQPPVPISESAAYTTQSIRNNIRQLLFVRRLRVDRPGTMPWMNWSPGLWSLLAFHAPKSHLVLADPMGNGRVVVLWSSGGWKATDLGCNSHLSVGRLIRCSSCPWSWSSSPIYWS